MMIPTQPEDSHELDPIMWAVWQRNVDEIHIERIVADKETAERVASSLNLLRRTQTGFFSGRASGLAASVQEQGRLLGHRQLIAQFAELGAEVHETHQAVATSHPVINSTPGESGAYPAEGAAVKSGLAESYQSARHKPWWEVTHKGV